MRASSFLARQVTLVINPAVGCHYFLAGLRLPSQLQHVTAIGQYQVILFGEQSHIGAHDLSRVAMSQQNGRGLNRQALDHYHNTVPQLLHHNDTCIHHKCSKYALTHTSAYLNC